MTFTPASGGAKVTIAQNLTPATNTNCARTGAAVACTIAFQIAPGTYVGAIGLFDGSLSAQGQPTGNELSSGQSVAVTFARGQSNTVSLTLDGIPKNVVVASTSPAVHIAGNGDLALYGTAPQTIQVNAVDADGNTIAGPGSPSFALTVTGGNITATATAGSTNAFVLTPAATDAAVATGSLALKATSPGNGCSQTGATCTKTVALSNHVQTLFIATLIVIDFPVTAPGVETFSTPFAPPGTQTVVGFDTINAVAADAFRHCVVAATGVPVSPNLTADTPGFSVLVTAVGATATSAAAFDAAGDLFAQQGTTVVEYSAASIAGVLGGASATSVPPTRTVQSDALAQPTALAFDSAQDLFVLNAGAGTVTEYAPPYTALTSTIRTPTSANATFALDPKGDLFVENGNTVTIFAPAATAAAATIASTGNLTGLAVDAFGDAFVRVVGGNVQEYAPPWTTATTAITLASTATPATITSQSMGIDGAGDLFVIVDTPPVPPAVADTFSVLEYAPPYSGPATTLLAASPALPLLSFTL